VSSPPKRRKPVERKSDTGAFYREWLKKPLEVAALSPSSPQLANAVAGAVGDAARVVELGGGTGAVTAVLAVPAGRDLVVVEYNPSFAALLRRRFPAARVTEGDAREAVRLVAEAGLAPGSVDVVVSGLGMLTRTREEQRELLLAMIELLRPGGHVVQYTYSPVFPAAKGLLDELGLEARRAAVILFNLPPASVFVVRRRD